MSVANSPNEGAQKNGKEIAAMGAKGGYIRDTSCGFCRCSKSCLYSLHQNSHSCLHHPLTRNWLNSVMSIPQHRSSVCFKLKVKKVQRLAITEGLTGLAMPCLALPEKLHKFGTACISGHTLHLHSHTALQPFLRAAPVSRALKLCIRNDTLHTP